MGKVYRKRRKDKICLDSKTKKRMISLGLAFGLAITAIPLWQIPVTAQAAETAVVLDTTVRGETAAVTLESVRAEANTKYTVSQTGFDLDLSGQTFDGSTSLDYSTDADGRKYMQVFENLRTGTNDQTVIVRFKTGSPNGLLFGAGANPPANASAENGTSTTLGLTNGKLRLVMRNSRGSGLKGTFASSLADGQWHTVAVSFVPSLGNAVDNVRLVIDGGEDLYAGTGWGNSWIAGLNQSPNTAYTTFQIGGGGYVNQDSASAAFQGTIDFITVIDKAYTVDELKKITAGDKNSSDDFGVMTASGSRNTWMFTGGTEAVADFGTSGMTRNFVGMFEDKLRESGTYVERGRFVFNLAKKDADVAYILENYDTLIAPYGTKAVGIVAGASDYSKGTEGIAAFQASLQALLDRIYEDDKLPFIVTPYPSLDSSVNAQISAYVDAIHETAGKRTRVVDVSSISVDLVQADGSLSPVGHQTVANLIKSTLGVGTTTNFTYDLGSGSYTVAKKTAEGDEAQVKKVTAGADSIQVSAEAASVSGSAVRLTYTLTDSKGQEISGAGEEGQTDFSVCGLKPGETYTLNVYDVSRGNVAESYQPVSITIVEGADGINQKYADGNVSSNEIIQSLLTSEDPVTYLFMGDSITHGVVTEGYDNVPMLFKKYLNELDRTDDVVLNTGVTNATIATTLDQIDMRLEQYDPDVVFVMLGTNDCATNGENVVEQGIGKQAAITPEDFKERYKELVRKIYGNNPDGSIVLRVPCAMADTINPGQNRTRYEEFFAVIPDVAEEMRQEIPGLNIVVIDHLADWRNYRDNVRNDNIAANSSNNYSGAGWLVADGVHPNGRGNVAMFQQIIKELGLYVNSSEMANYQFTLDNWTGVSDIPAAVTRRATRASFAMSDLDGYANGLRNVTLTLEADGLSISKTEEYSENGTITLDGLDTAKEYTVTVTGKDAVNSREITFGASLTKQTDITATDDEKKELKDSMEEAKMLDISAYPAEVRAAYEAEIQKIEESFLKEVMTVAEVDEALAQVRLAQANLVKWAEAAEAEKEAAEAERKAARADLDEVLAATESTHRAGKNRWTDESWAAYDTAYQAAMAANENTDAAALKQLLANLKNAEAGLTVRISDAPVNLQPIQTIEEGKTYDVGGYRYKVTSTSNLTAEVVGIKNTSLTKINVPPTVTIGGKSCKVTSVGASAFKGNRRVTTAVIGKNVQTIGKNAFAGCTKLKKVTVKGNSLKQIGAKAFFQCKGLKTVTIKSKVLKKAGKNIFKGINKKAVIKVPSSKQKAYTKLLAKKGQSSTVKIK